MRSHGWVSVLRRASRYVVKQINDSPLSTSTRCSPAAVQPKGRIISQDSNRYAQVGRLLYRIWSLQVFPAANPNVLVSLVEDLASVCQARDAGLQRRQRAQQVACAKLGRATAVCVHLLQPQQVLSCLVSFPDFTHPPSPELPRLLLACLSEDDCRSFRQLPVKSIANIAWALARLQAKGLVKELKPLLKVAAPSLDHFAPNDASLLFLSLLRLQYPEHAVLSQLSQCTQRHAHLLRHRTIVSLIQAMAISRYNDPALLQPLLTRARLGIPRFDASHLSMMAWALAVMDLREQRPLMKEILAASQKMLARFSMRHLANLMWASGILQVMDVSLLQQLCSHPEALLRKCNAADVSTILFALAQLNYCSTFVADCAAKRFCSLLSQQGQHKPGNQPVRSGNRGKTAATRQTVVESSASGAGSSLVSIRSCSNMLWALARLRHHHEQTLKLATAHVATQFASITPTELMQVCWACATLAHYSPQLVKCLDKYWPSLAPNLTPEQMIHIAWSCSMMGYFNTDFYKSLFNSLKQQDGKRLCTTSLCQLFQVYIILHSAFRLSARQGFRPPSLPRSLLQRAQWEWISQNKSRVSAVQREMHDTLVRVNFQPVLELATADGVFNIDIALQHSGLKLAVEVDGPTHFTSNGPPFRPLGPTLSRWQCLEDRGWHVVSIRVQEWSELHTNKQKEQFLLSTIMEAVQAASQNKQHELLTGRDGMGYKRDERLGEGPRTWTARDFIKLVE